MQMLPVHINKAKLDQIPEGHRIAYFGLGQIANEAAVLNRTILAAINSAGPPAPVIDMANATSMLCLRMLVGRLYEAHLFIKGPQVGPAYRDLSDALRRQFPDQCEAIDAGDSGRRALASLMNGSSQLKAVRQRSSFHIDPELLAAAYRLLPDDVDLVDHVSHRRRDGIYGATETLHGLAFAFLFNTESIENGLGSLIDKINEALSALSDFIDAFMFAFTVIHFGRDATRTVIDVPAVTQSELRLQLFFEP